MVEPANSFCFTATPGTPSGTKIAQPARGNPDEPADQGTPESRPSFTRRSTMREAIELIGSFAAAGWKIVCVACVLCLGIVILDRRGRTRAVRQVQRVEQPRQRRAA